MYMCQRECPGVIAECQLFALPGNRCSPVSGVYKVSGVDLQGMRWLCARDTGVARTAVHRRCHLCLHCLLVNLLHPFVPRYLLQSKQPVTGVESYREGSDTEGFIGQYDDTNLVIREKGQQAAKAISATCVLEQTVASVTTSLPS